MSSKLFVGSLSWGTTDEALREAFEKFGEIAEAKVIRDRETGRSRGFGFVTYTTPESAQSALSAMNGSQLDGRTIRVDTATDSRKNGNGGGGGGGGRDRGDRGDRGGYRR